MAWGETEDRPLAAVSLSHERPKRNPALTRLELTTTALVGGSWINLWSIELT